MALRLLTFVLIAACLTAGPASAQKRVKPKTVDIGAFTVSESESPLTKVKMTTISTFDEDNNGMLGWWCAESGLAVLIGLSGDVAREARTVDVRYVLGGDQPSESSGWMVQRQGGFSLAYIRPDLIPVFDRKAHGASEARVEVFNPSNSAVLTYKFSMEGFADARSRLTCEYPKWP